MHVFFLFFYFLLYYKFSNLFLLLLYCIKGLYIVGSGSTGAVEALGTMGLVYFSVILASALIIRKPHPSYKPAVAAIASTPAATGSAQTVKPATAVAVIPDVTVGDAMKAPQFHLLGITFFCLATGVSIL